MLKVLFACYSAALLFLTTSPAVSGCTSGFMQLNLLKRRAEKISSANLFPKTVLNDETRVMPGLNFTCNGNITSLMLAVDVRTVSNSKTDYPEVQVWERTMITGFYTRGDHQNIRLSAGDDFSPDGVLQYKLIAPMSFQSGDVLGMYQPVQSDSVVRVFYANDPEAPVAERREFHYIENIIMIDQNSPSTKVSNQSVLLSLTTDPPQCTNNAFFTPEELRQRTLEVNINRVLTRDQQQRVFPDITFTCNGSITKWIVGAGTGGGSSPPSELQIWRRSGSDYTKVGSTQLTAQSPIGDSNVYEYIPSPPLGFQEGDILGVYQRDNSSIVPYYQESTGPLNLRLNGSVETVPDNLTSVLQASEHDYPLVTVEIGPVLSLITITSTSLLLSTDNGPSVTSITQKLTPSADILFTTAVLQLTTKGLLPSLISLVTSTNTVTELPVSPSVTTSAQIETGSSSILTSFQESSSLALTPSTAKVTESIPLSTATATITQENPVGNILSTMKASSRFTVTVTGVKVTDQIETLSVLPTSSTSPATMLPLIPIIAGVVVLALLCCLVIVLVSITIAVSKRRKKKPSITSYEMNVVIDNTAYAGHEGHANHYDLDNGYAKITNGAPRTADNGGYLAPGAVLATNEKNSSELAASASVYTEMIVPTISQRRELTDTETGYYEVGYSKVKQEDTHQYKNVDASYFEDSVVYWHPASDCATIYEQLAKKKFREIIRDQVEIVEHLGSGQFGSVEKGLWQSIKGPVHVAVKTLKTEASENEKVKFMQEAAIMGQFRHPNVVMLHGVVTVGEPVMLVLELVKNGDMLQYLQKLKSSSGKLAPSSIPQQLLGYCRQIGSGMEYLSKKSFVHRDLAARNILVDDEKTCKIADFGMSRDLSDGDYYVSQGGKIPVKWTAPEALHYKKYSTASDVWSFSVLMYEIWSLGRKPFLGKTNRQAIDLIDAGYRLPPPPGCPRAVYQIMMDCWNSEAPERPSFTDVVTSLFEPEDKLLKCAERESTDSEAATLGAPLEAAHELFTDLQQQYIS